MRRVVFDTTVLICAFISRDEGICYELLALARNGKFELVLSSAIILETWRKLMPGEHIRARYTYSDQRAHRFCRGLLGITTDVLRTAKPLSSVVRDPNDDMIVAAAIGSRVDTIISREGSAITRQLPRGADYQP